MRKYLALGLLCVLIFWVYSTQFREKKPSERMVRAGQELMTFYMHPDVSKVPEMIKVASEENAIKNENEPEATSGFLAGVFKTNQDKALEVTHQLAFLPRKQREVLYRAIAWSGAPNSGDLLEELEKTYPEDKSIIQKYASYTSVPSVLDVIYKDYLTPQENESASNNRILGRIQSGIQAGVRSGVLDFYWGYYFATGAVEPISLIVSTLKWGNNKDILSLYVTAEAARWSLESNATQDPNVMEILKRLLPQEPAEISAPLNK